MGFKIRPVQDVVWILPDAKPEKSDSGLIHFMPENRETREYDDQVKGGKIKVLGPEKDSFLTGSIIAIGPGKYGVDRFNPTHLKIGDKIIIPPNCGVEQVVDGVCYLVMREEKIYAQIIQGENANGRRNSNARA